MAHLLLFDDTFLLVGFPPPPPPMMWPGMIPPQAPPPPPPVPPTQPPPETADQPQTQGNVYVCTHSVKGRSHIAYSFWNTITMNCRGGWTHSHELPRAPKINNFLRRVVYWSQYKVVKCHWFVMKNLCNKSSEVVCIKLLLLNFTPKIECFYKAKCIAMMLTWRTIGISSELHWIPWLFLVMYFPLRVTWTTQ